MKPSIIIKALSLFLFIAFFIVFSYNSSFPKEQEEISYSINTKTVYYPGDNVELNLYSYNYSAKGKKTSIKLDITVYRIKDIHNFFTKQNNLNNFDVLGTDSTNLLYSVEEEYSFSKEFKSRKGFDYLYINESVPINIRNKGAYLIKVSSGKRVAYCGFIITELGVIKKTGSGAVLSFVVDRKSGKPVSNADLSLYIYGNKIAGGKTNNEGILVNEFNFLDVKDRKNNISDLILGYYNDDVVISDPRAYFGFAERKFMTYIFTNQPVYRTNSEVLFKGTVRLKNINDYGIYADKEITVKIMDSRGSEVYKNNTFTNENGSFDGSYFIPEDAPLGDYRLYAYDNNTSIGSCVFTVEQYKKPEYKVVVTADKGQYYGDDVLKAVIEAKYFFGSPVVDAEVEYEIHKIRYYKPWWKYSEYAWWYEDYYAEYYADNYDNAVFIYSNSGILNSEGKLEIEYKIDEKFESENYNDYKYWWWRDYDTDYKYLVYARVVDKSRREITGMTAVFVTRGGFALNVRTDKYFYSPGNIVTIETGAFDFTDKPVSTDFTANIYKYEWGKWDISNKKLVASLDGKTESNGKGFVRYTIPESDAEGSYTTEIVAKDERRNVVKTSTSFYVSSGEKWWWYDETSGGIQILSDKDSYKKGDVCKIVIMSPVENVDALITSENGNVIDYKVEKFYGKSKVINITIDDKYVSNFTVTVNFVKDNVYYTQSKQLMIIAEDKFLTVEIDPLKEIFKPKESGLLKVRVLDNDGNPVRNAEVSIGIIDESIYSIKEDNTKDIRKFFYGKSFNPVYSSYTGSYNNYGYSRLLSIYEMFDMKSMKEKEFGTVKGILTDKENNPVIGAVIVINEIYEAAYTDDSGKFEFKLPEGEFNLGILTDDEEIIGDTKLKVKKGITTDIKLVIEDGDVVQRYPLFMTDEMNGGIVLQQMTLKPESKEAPKRIEAETKDKKNGKEDAEKMKEAEIRTDFKDAILWSPYTATDTDGYALVMVNYPDNLTSWRMTARVISADTKVGQNIKNVVTRKDLLVRMETPRFFQYKDEVTVSTTIHNYLSTEKQVKVKFKSEGTELLGDNEKTLNIPSNSDRRLDWKVKVNQAYGDSKLYVEALTNEESDAMEIKVPMQPRGLQVSVPVITDFSESGKTEIKYFDIPSNTDMKTSKFKFTSTPSLAATIMNSLDELIGYPYGCVEQTMSRFLPSAMVANTLKNLNIPVEEKIKTELPKMVDAGIKKLYSFQHSDGGWGWWTNDNSNPFMTAYVVYGLSVAQNSGYNIKNDVIARGVKKMKDFIKDKDIDATTKAYIIYVVAVSKGKSESAFVKDNIETIKNEKLNNYALSLISLSLYYVDEVNSAKDYLEQLERNATVSETTVYWEGQSFHYRWQDDKVQTTAFALKAFVNVNPQSDKIDKIIRWLVMQRMGVSWRSTQETAMIVYSFVDYMKISKELEPDYNLKVYLNDNIILDRDYTSKDVFIKAEYVNIDASKLKAGNNEIKIVKNGNGKVYFSSNAYYFLDEDKIKPVENGFRVEREYFKLEKYEKYNTNEIIYRKKYFDGNVTSGDYLLVNVKVYSKEKEMNYFMLEDPIPAGCEVIKDDWTFNIENEESFSGNPYWYWRWWYADKDIRDDKITFFATYLYGGEQKFSYILRAQIPGEYTINPSKGALMYYTDYNGSTNNEKIVITDK